MAGACVGVQGCVHVGVCVGVGVCVLLITVHA